MQTDEIVLPDQLIQKAESQGYLVLDDLMAAMPELEKNMALLEEVFIYLVNRELPVYSDPVEARAKRKDSAPAEIEADVSEIPADDTLKLYLRDMMRTPLLTYEQEVALAKQLEKGQQAKKQLKKTPTKTKESLRLKAQVKRGEQARNHLIRANTRLVVSVAKKYTGHGVPLIDLIQEGNLGLMKATTKFDHRRGFKFSTYATWWIRQAVTRALASQGQTIRIPVHMNDRFRKLRQVSAELEQVWGRKPTPEELAENMELHPAKVRWMLKTSQRAISLQSPVGNEEDTELGYFIEDKTAPSPLDATFQGSLREALRTELLNLSPREARVLELRFGLQDGRSYSLQEVGQKFGLTRERIRQIEKLALRRLRHPSRARSLKDFLD